MGTATPFPSPTPEPTPDPEATPRPAPTPTPLPTPVSTPPATVEGDNDPPHPSECLHCWRYLGPTIPTPDDAHYIRTEDYLREHYDARSERVQRCGACPMVFGRHNTSAAANLLYPNDISGPNGETWIVFGLDPVATERFVRLVEDRLGDAIANGWVVPISTTHHIRDVAGMIAYPLQPYPLHEVGAWALTWDGFQEVSARRTDDTPVPGEDLSATILGTECAFCWRYPDGLSPTRARLFRSAAGRSVPHRRRTRLGRATRARGCTMAVTSRRDSMPARSLL